MKTLLLLLAITLSLKGQNTLLYCSFDSASASACTPSGAVQSAPTVVSPSGRFSNGLRICKGPACAGAGSSIILKQPVLNARRGTFVFWTKINDNTLTGDGTNQIAILQTNLSSGPATNVYLTNLLPKLMCSNGNPTSCTTAGGEPHELADGDPIYFDASPSGWTLQSGGSACTNSAGANCWPVTVTGPASFTIPIDSTNLPNWGSFGQHGHSQDKYLAVLQAYYLYSGKSLRELSTQRTPMPPGTWHQIAFTWTGTQFSSFADGLPSVHYSGNLMFSGSGSIRRSPWQATGNAHSAMPVGFGTLKLNTNNSQDISIDELASYDWAMNADEVANAYAASVPGPALISGSHGLQLNDVRWSPEGKRVWFGVDAGNDNLSSVTSWQVEVQLNGTTIASASYSPEAVAIQPASNGQYSGWIDLPSVMQSGTYVLNARAYGATGFIGDAVCTASNGIPNTGCTLAYAQDPWVADTAGAIDTTPSPWTDIEVSSNAPNLDLTLWGRTYTLSGGYGLPQQITSKDTTTGTPIALLTGPIALNVVQGRNALNLANLGIALTKVTGPQVWWRGRSRTTNAEGGSQIDFTVDGSLMYDGYMMLSITAQPVSSPVSLDTVSYSITLPAGVSRYLWLYSDSITPFSPQWMATLDSVSAGTIATQSTAGTAMVPGVLKWYVASDDVALFGSHPKGFASFEIGKSNAGYQTWRKNADGSITFTENFINYSSSNRATLDRPLTWTFALIPGPAKPAVPGMRAWANSFGSGSNWSNANAPWVFQYKQTAESYWSPFAALFPAGDWAGWKGEVTYDRAHHRKALPFLNAHILTTNSTLGANVRNCDDADQNDGWDSTPSPCSTSLWAWSMDMMTNPALGYNGVTDVVDGEYIDESYGYLASNNPLSCGRKLGDFLELASCYDDLSERRKIIRMYNILQSHGKAGMWYHITDFPQLDILSHVPLVLEGERPAPYVTTNSPGPTTGIDSFGSWNGSGYMVNPQASNLSGQTTPTYAGAFYRGAESPKKWGWKTAFWRGMNTGGTNQASFAFWPWQQRKAQCLHALNDALQADELQDGALVRYDFFSDGGFTATDVFHPYWEQSEIVSGDSNVIASYYTRPSNNTALIYAANTGAADSVDDPITLDPPAMGLTGTPSAQVVSWNSRCFANQTGAVNVAGVNVTWVSGTNFANLAGLDERGLPISFDGGATWKQISSVRDAQHLVLTNSAATASGVAYTINGCFDPANFPSGQTYTYNPLTVSNNRLTVTVPRHDCSIIKVTAQ